MRSKIGKNDRSEVNTMTNVMSCREITPRN